MTTTTATSESGPGPLDTDAGVRLLSILKSQGYHFITTTPATHRTVLRRPGKALASDARDVFGWSLPFAAQVLSPDLFAALRAAGGLREDALGWRSAYRVSSLGEDLFLHSAFPPSAEDAVFFGPDTYRFARLLRQVVGSGEVGRLVDIGTGSGAGAVVAARSARIASFFLTDVNPVALATARINLAAAGLSADFQLGSGLEAVAEPADLIIANPPFIAGDGGRTYRDGGDMIGARLSLDWSLAATAKLVPQGRFVLYTGSAIVGGVDALRQALTVGLDSATYALTYEELDPDIFGGQLSARDYEAVERIAAIGAVVTRRV